MINLRISTASVLLAAICLAGCPEKASGPDQNSDSCVKPTLTPGGSLSGNTGQNRCKGAIGFGNFYTLVVTQSSPVTLSITGNTKRVYLGLYTSDEKLIFQRPSTDDAPTVALPIVLAPGTYLLRVDLFSGADFSYTISAPTLTLTTCVSDPGVFVTKGASFSGTVTSASCRDPGGLPIQSFLLVGSAPTSFTVTTTLDKNGRVIFSGNGAPVAQQTFGPGSWTTPMTTQNLVVDPSLTYYIQQMVISASSGSSVPVAYTVKAE
jgi:hypothetical protein